MDDATTTSYLNITFIRHSERDRDGDDPQQLTPFGSELAILTGHNLWDRGAVSNITDVYSSPQRRTQNTLEGLFCGIGCFWDEYTVEQRLQDWSSDDRPEIVQALRLAIIDRESGPDVDIEEIILMTSGPVREALKIKALEALKLVTELRENHPDGGDILVCMHGATIDALMFLLSWMNMRNISTVQDFPWDAFLDGISGNGYQVMRYSEGFTASFAPGDGWPSEINEVRWPGTEEQLRDRFAAKEVRLHLQATQFAG